MARILVPFDGRVAAEYALDVACSMAAIDGDEVCAVYVIRVPLQLPISAHVPAEQVRAERLFERAHAIADRYQAALTTMVVEARHLGPAIVEAAQGCACIICGRRARGRFVLRWLGGRTLRYVVAHVPCQVLVGYMPSAGALAATQQFLLVHGAARDHATGNVLRLPEHRRPPAQSIATACAGRGDLSRGAGGSPEAALAAPEAHQRAYRWNDMTTRKARSRRLPRPLDRCFAMVRTIVAAVSARGATPHGYHATCTGSEREHAG